MPFVLKKVLSQFLMPETFSILLIIIGLAFIYLNKKKTAKKILITGILFLLIFSNSFIAHMISSPLEYYYPPLTEKKASRLENIKYVVVLSGGINRLNSVPDDRKVGKSSLARLVEGLRLLKIFPNSKIILSGGGSALNGKTSAELMQLTALNLGINKNRILLEATSHDTAAQAENIKKLVKDNKFILVTSAIHMPRSMFMFKLRNMHPVPSPTGYSSYNKKFPYIYFPSSGNLHQSRSAFHEYIGLTWYYILSIFK
ncbi:MAG: YdcF family protein [Victivallales bacterium]|nr:YdcF family protein [Victivallales bacterium]